MTVSIGSFYPLWLLSAKFKELFLNSFTRFISHFCYLEVQSKEQEISKLSLQRQSVSVDVSDQNFLSFRSAKEYHGRFVHATRDQTARFANSPTRAKHLVMKEKQMMMKAAAIKKKSFFLVTCIVHRYILVGWWFVLSNGGLRKNRNETKLISQNSIFVLYHMTTRRCCHNIVQSSFLPAFASWSRFSISLMMVWKISCTLCGKERNIRAQFKRMKG